MQKREQERRAKSKSHFVSQRERMSQHVRCGVVGCAWENARLRGLLIKIAKIQMKQRRREKGKKDGGTTGTPCDVVGPYRQNETD